MSAHGGNRLETMAYTLNLDSILHPLTLFGLTGSGVKWTQQIFKGELLKKNANKTQQNGDRVRNFL